MPNFIDLTGQRFGRWTVIRRAPQSQTGGKKILWVCKCDCGEIREVLGDSLRSGKSVSCGCFRADTIREIGKRYKEKVKKYDGPFDRGIYNSWYSMIGRCYNKNHKSYKDYGGRGITVCDEWRTSYLIFREWAIANGYKNNLSIDRIDVNGNYEPSNCRWATAKEQGNNRRNNHFLEAHGQRKTLTQWADFFGVRLDRVQYYVTRGYSGERFYEKMMSLSNKRG